MCSCPSDPLLPPPGAVTPQQPTCNCYKESEKETPTSVNPTTTDTGEEEGKKATAEDDVLNFLKYKEDFKRQMNFSGMLCR